jgi:hypothetical protein
VKLYSSQAEFNPQMANICYEFLQSDSSWLYLKYSSTHGINVNQPPPQYNIDNWLNPDSPKFKPELAEAICYYQAQTEKDERFHICIQTTDMKEVAVKYLKLLLHPRLLTPVT